MTGVISVDIKKQVLIHLYSEYPADITYKKAGLMINVLIVDDSSTMLVGLTLKAGAI